MRQGWETVLYFLESGKPVCEETISSRGLHKRTDSGAWELYECQRDARNAVFEVQERQRKAKRTDPYEISLAYLQHTAKSQVEALEQGAVDAKSVDKFKRKKSKKYEKSPKKSTQSSKKSPKPKSPLKKTTSPRPCVLQDSFFFRNPNSPVPSPKPSPKPNRNVLTTETSRRVQFNDELTFIKAKKVKDIDKAIKRRWLSEKELHTIAKSFKSTVKLMEKGVEVEETEEQTARGLEHITKEGQKKLAQHRKKVLDTVIKTQENGSALQNVLDNILQIQEKSKTYDVETLAEAYRNMTADDARRAVKQGKQDARDAKRNRVRRRSIQGCLGQKLTNESKEVVLLTTPSISTEESSTVEPEFVRLAKKRRERRASIADSRSFRQKHRAMDISIEESIAKVQSADKAGKAAKSVQLKERERTPTPPQDRWCRMRQSPGAKSPTSRSPKAQKKAVACNSPRACVDASSEPSLGKQKKANAPRDTETPTKPHESESRTKESDSTTVINANLPICSKDDTQLRSTPVPVATPALSTKCDENPHCNSSASPSDKPAEIHPPEVASTSNKLGETDALVLARDLTNDEAEPKPPVVTTAVVELHNQQHSVKENPSVDTRQTSSPKNSIQCDDGVVPSKPSGNIGNGEEIDLGMRDDKDLMETTDTKEAQTDDLLSVPSQVNVQVDTTIDESDTESVCTRTSVTALASKFNIPRTISSDSRVSACSGISRLRASEALVRNVSGTSSIGSYLETISRTSKSSDSKFDAPPIPKRMLRLPHASLDGPTKPCSGSVSSKESFSPSSEVPSTAESEADLPSVNVASKAASPPSLNECGVGDEVPCVAETEQPTSSHGTVENATSLPDYACSVGEPQTSTPLVKDDTTTVASAEHLIEPSAVDHSGSVGMKAPEAVPENSQAKKHLPIANNELQGKEQICDSVSKPTAPSEGQDLSGADPGNVPRDGDNDITAVQCTKPIVAEVRSNAREIQPSKAAQAASPSLALPRPTALPEPTKLVPKPTGTRQAQTIETPLPASSGESINTDRAQSQVQSSARAKETQSITAPAPAPARQDLAEPLSHGPQPIPIAATPQLPTVHHTTSTPFREEPAVSLLNPNLVQPLPPSASVEQVDRPAAVVQQQQQSLLDASTAHNNMVWLQVRQSDLVPIPSADGRTMYLVLAYQQRQTLDPSSPLLD